MISLVYRTLGLCQCMTPCLPFYLPVSGTVGIRVTFGMPVTGSRGLKALTRALFQREAYRNHYSTGDPFLFSVRTFSVTVT